MLCKNSVRVSTGSGKVRKSGITLKMKKSQEKLGKSGVFEKSQEKSEILTKFKKKSDLVSTNLQNFIFSKALKW